MKNSQGHKIAIKTASWALLLSVFYGLFFSISARHQVSMAGNWLAGWTKSDGNLSRDSILETSKQFTDRQSFFAWAADLLQTHPESFEFPFSSKNQSHNDVQHQLEALWNDKTRPAGMASTEAAIEPVKTWHFEGKSDAQHRVQALANDISLDVLALSESAIDARHSLKPMVSGISIGAP